MAAGANGDHLANPRNIVPDFDRLTSGVRKSLLRDKDSHPDQNHEDNDHNPFGPTHEAGKYLSLVINIGLVIICLGHR